MHATTNEDLQTVLANLREIDPWQNIGDDEWKHIPRKVRADWWDRHIEERIVSYIDDEGLMDLRFMSSTVDARLEEFERGKVTIWLDPISWLAEHHRETIQAVVDEVLQAYAPGYWEVEDWDDLYVFPRNGVIATLAGHLPE